MATKVKKNAMAVNVPQSKSDCAAAVKDLGDLQRQHARMATEMNDQIAQITEKYQPLLSDLDSRISNVFDGIQAFCEAHRAELTLDGKTKTANLTTGEVAWRARPPSVQIRGAESVIETLKRMSLTKFIRTKEEPNKEAMLNEPSEVRGIAGISINTGIEDFLVTPFEVAVETST